MISSETQNTTSLGKSSRILKNWQKVRVAMKKLSRNQLILDTKNPEQSSVSKCKLKIIQKIQQQLQCQQYKQFVESLSSLLDKGYTLVPLTLIQNSQIIETTNIIRTKGLLSKHQQIMQIKTFKPIPKINYLVRQETGQETVDATGAWVWEAEEVLAYFLMIQFDSYRASKVLEIGAGCSGLASLVYAKVWHAKMQMAKLKSMNDVKKQQEVVEQLKVEQQLECLITDGKSDNIILLRKNIDEFYNNLISKQEQLIKIRGQTYLWGNQLAIEQFQSNKVYTNCSFAQFDLILAADCLFFQQYHTCIIRTLQLHLREDTGIALFVNPSRGYSFDNFIKSLHQENTKNEGKFTYTTKTIDFADPRYTSSIQAIRLQPAYNKDTDQLIFLQVQKKRKVEIKYQYEG